MNPSIWVLGLSKVKQWFSLEDVVKDRSTFQLRR